MHTIALVSILSALNSTPSTGHAVTVHSLVQGSGTVIVFAHASDMRKADVKVSGKVVTVRARGGK